MRSAVTGVNFTGVNPVQQGKNAGIKNNAGKSEVTAVEPLSGCSYRSPGKEGFALA